MLRIFGIHPVALAVSDTAARLAAVFDGGRLATRLHELGDTIAAFARSSAPGSARNC